MDSKLAKAGLIAVFVLSLPVQVFLAIRNHVRKPCWCFEAGSSRNCPKHARR